MTQSILPDAMDETRLVLIKACTKLLLTNEIRRAAETARQTRRTFILAVPENCALHLSLLKFIEQENVSLIRTRS
jgi:hypothetical protein